MTSWRSVRSSFRVTRGALITWGSTASNYEERFTGQLRDSSGLDYFFNQYYSAPLGRFMSPDPGNAGSSPGDPQTWNAYSYVRNQPLTNVDPTGQSFWSVLGDIFSLGLSSLGSGDPFQEWGSLAGPPMSETPPIPPVSSSPGMLAGGILPGESGGIPTGLSAGGGGFSAPCDFGSCGSGIGPSGYVESDPIEKHHALPEQFEDWFERQGIEDIDDFIILMKRSAHRLKIGPGLHTKIGGNWNEVWEKWISANKNASVQDIIDQLNKMIRDFKVPNAKNFTAPPGGMFDFFIVDTCKINPYMAGCPVHKDSI